jgi:uncharacterized hydrophobic protein (TIGR00271 family)
MSPEDISTVQKTVQFSRVMGLRRVVALGVSISGGLGVFVLLGQFVQAAGEQTLGVPYLVMAVIAVPLILTYAERMGVLPGSGGAYNLAHHSGIVWLTYSSGWLLLGGYVSLVALLGWGVALHLNLLTEFFFNLSLDLSLLAAVVLGLAALLNILGSRGSWQARSTYIFLSLIILFLVIIRDLFRPAEVEQTIPLLHDTSRILTVTTLMMVGLWGLQFILNSRDEIHRPTRTLLSGLSLTVALGAGLGALAGLALFRYGAMPTSLTPLVEIASDIGLIPRSLIVVLYGSFGLLISLIALNQSIVHSLRLVGDMTRDGFWPDKLQTISDRYEAPIVSLFLLAVSSLLLVMLVPILTLVGLAALFFLWVTALVHLPGAFGSKLSLPEKRFPKLPFHPLFPWVTIAIAIFMPFNLPAREWVLAAIWVLVGILYYFSYAHQRGLEVHRREFVVAEAAADRPEDRAEYVVLAGIANPKSAPSLLRAGARLARARNGTLLALKVLALAEQMPAHLKRQAAEKEWQTLSALVEAAGIGGITIKPLVRLASDLTDGILEAVGEEGVDLLLLGWAGEQPPEDAPLDSVIDPLIKRVPCDVAVLRGKLPQLVKRVLVPTAGGPYASVALALGRDLAETDDYQIFVETMVEEYLTPEHEAQATADLQATLDSAKNGFEAEQRILEVDTVKAGILSEAEAVDLLLMGVSKKGYPERPFLGGLATEVATAAATPTILARGRETRRRFWLRRLWEILADSVPTLTEARQSEVYQNMREAARPTVDFFVMMTLAATIASLGLLLDSAAVIIGAMLVAPLMSPILAIGMSIVQGDLRLLLVAAEATVKGVTVAIIVGIAMVIISPTETATDEILARTQPNVLDLMIALASGAAAGYAISRKEVAAALPGVAIAAALVPPLCVVGYGIGTSQLDIAGGALLLFITNLIAIIFAAAITFLALGFQPARARQGELMRGLKVSVFLLVIIFLILAVTTVRSMTQLNRQAEVEQIFTSEVVARAGDVREVTVEPDRDGFTITATIINFDESQLTPDEIAHIEAQLTEAVGGPVTAETTLIPASQVAHEAPERVRQLENLFEEKMAEQGAEVVEMTVDETTEGLTITAMVIAFEGEISQVELAGVRQELSETMAAPVTVRTNILPGTRVDVEAPDPATPTPEP